LETPPNWTIWRMSSTPWSHVSTWFQFRTVGTAKCATRFLLMKMISLSERKEIRITSTANQNRRSVFPTFAVTDGACRVSSGPCGQVVAKGIVSDRSTPGHYLYCEDVDTAWHDFGMTSLTAGNMTNAYSKVVVLMRISTPLVSMERRCSFGIATRKVS
jgi:hypothetical protein